MTARKRLLLLPGSRRSEIRRLLPVMRDAHALLAADGAVAAVLVTVPICTTRLRQFWGMTAGSRLSAGATLSISSCIRPMR